MPIDFESRLAELRARLAKSSLDGFLVPMSDEYQSEYVPASARRIEFLSGFTGSSGFVVVLNDKAAFFTDGRYTLQAQQQVSSTVYSLLDMMVTSPAEWLAANTLKGAKIGFDPWLQTEESITRFKKAVAKAEAELIAVDENPIDAIWLDQPSTPCVPIYAYDFSYTGRHSADKRASLADELRRKDLVAAVITDPASIAWLLNVRGGDVPNTPLPLSFAILYDNGKVKWFVEQKKLTQGLEKHLGPDISAEHPDQFPYALDRLGREGRPVRIDPGESAYWIVERLRQSKAKLDFGEDPCVMPKACKNAMEVEGMRTAHRRDGATLVQFFAWLSRSMAEGAAVTELAAEEKLANLRAMNNLYRGPSFDTIAGTGPHGAIVHYRSTKASDRQLMPGQLFLLDSGGQYLDGTTDVTRTLAIGTPTSEMRDRFTRVLRGHIALASIRFPAGTTGAELDVLARQHLWFLGYDYNHGTGHGVGNFLGVHEGPQGISKRNRVALQPGMVVSNEPGYYKPGHYGIRIENLQVVTDAVNISGERKMLAFETLTLAPIDLTLVDKALMNPDEVNWLNAYHARVRDVIYPMVDEASAKWLVQATREL